MDAAVYIGSPNPWEMPCQLASPPHTVFLHSYNINHETRQTIIAVRPSA